MSDHAAAQALGRGARRRWQRRLTHSRVRLLDLAFFHVLLAAVGVLVALGASVLVVAVTRTDGNVRVSVAFVAVLVALLVGLRAAARAGLRSAERRIATTAAAESRAVMLGAIADGASLPAGAVARFVTTSSADVGEFLSRAVPARVAAGPSVLVVLVVEGLVDPWSALIAAGVLLAAPFALRAFGQQAQREAETSLSRLRSLSTRALELLEGAVELRALGALRRGREEIAAATDRAVASTRASLRIALRSGTVLDLLAGAAVGLVAMTDGFRLLAGHLELGHALSAVLLTAEVFVPVRTAGTAFHAGVDGRAAIAMLDAVAGGPDAAKAPPVGRALPNVAASPASVRAEALALRPAVGVAVVVQGLDVRLDAGEALLVTGPTGAGKSTLLRAVCGAPLVAGGTLLVGNAAPSALSARQRAALLAMVDQRPVLVAGSLRENLELGRRATGAAIDDAVARCGLADLLARCPRGLDEDVGEEGRLLSAGERTKVALARAVLRDPGVLLLDEVAAHLDDAALAVLRERLAGFLSERTVLEATHERALLSDARELRLGAGAVAVAR